MCQVSIVYIYTLGYKLTNQHISMSTLLQPPALPTPAATRTAASSLYPSNDVHDGCNIPSPSTVAGLRSQHDGRWPRLTRLLQRCTAGQLSSSSPLYIKSPESVATATCPLGSGAVGNSDSGCWGGFPSTHGCYG
ncbi:hypothetical protein M419DRAFT_123149 [Trichoderma reesei RUT C-30]|uniref:Uncharacterized protein n=1 Tax=Hypocrea jecorina (strain ATCC 56765 / BCRC 32924 / NRRL 11460 / Rut C-30) TaxID=1344414 RepID=A0A024SB85_HYPJR|nr:hypothetical protein M419DRAFT_123149 [Trichoderma reesei RUT C-30]